MWDFLSEVQIIIIIIIILFCFPVFQYNAQFHNVMQVTHAEYRACNTTSPKATYTTGNDSITITNRGHHYFFCGVPGHCQAGQKVDINVPRLQASSASPRGAPAPSSGSDDSRTVPASGVPDHSPNSGFATVGVRSRYKLGVAVAVLGLHCSIFG